MLAPIRNQDLNAINLHRSKLVGSTAASRSSNATTSNNPLDRLAAAQPPHPRPLNPHSQPRRVHTFPFPRFPPLEVFRRRPPQPVAPSASGRHPKTFTSAEVAALHRSIQRQENCRAEVGSHYQLTAVHRRLRGIFRTL